MSEPITLYGIVFYYKYSESERQYASFKENLAILSPHSMWQ